MLHIRRIEVAIHQNTLYLRRHHQEIVNVDIWDNNVTKGMEPIRIAKGGGGFNGIKFIRVLATSLAMLCTLILVIGWGGTPITNIIRYEERLATLLRAEAGLPTRDRNEYVTPAILETSDENDGLAIPTGCDYTQGRWVRDERRPLYSGKECTRWLVEMWACRLTNRTDFEYENYRWQPDGCHLPTFDGNKFLRRMKNKTLAFVGDSLGRQQFQSLMCLITGGKNETEVEDVSTEYGLTLVPGALRPDGWGYRFQETNTTVLFYWSASLSDLEPLNRSNPRSWVAMHLDRPPLFLRQNLRKFDVLILNTGHHWNERKFKRNKWKTYVEGKRVKTNSKLREMKNAYNFTVHSVMGWLNDQLENMTTQAFYRTSSPRHFTHGDWDSGGRCDNTRLIRAGPEVEPPEELELEKKKKKRRRKGSDPRLIDGVAESALAQAAADGEEEEGFTTRRRRRRRRVKLLNITLISEFRDEAHISKYSWKSKNGSQDCLHWCLPGVPDTWNEILYAHL